ncbi:MBL fold hydrolase [Streptomyces violarus]|uniref:Glyoxylase-like metal-dependent hydrolase (Beta-lactamase superfamily II) n=1 Tax=Streptomyces violarus TaxID=67380 RepID=A0A7W4ZR11_9ACTN|nr:MULTISPECIES: MBL fold metallo-hydrolase [Streptomyces]MBB3077036.1 glyoxylase-like metal-dependent hydrolase (beta-lactamase superfamily II) [Streptomyces violarus]WRU01310.1 MBL fold metallo-hydrolase [Streptomyces sp. CGMCC 4.1772]GHD18181.1 MBL fold hydrolase [Streptomyces violarus]
MTVTWEELGWERVAAGVGRCRLPVWDCTAGLVAGEGAALMIDAGSSPAEGVRLRTQAQSLTGHRVTHLALTHPHFDHVFGAAAFPETEVFGAVGVDAVLTRVRDREELRADAVRNGLAAPVAQESADRLVPPRHLVSGEWTLDLGGGRQVLLANVGPGHTAHDLAVLVPGDPEVVFCGDLVEESGEPQAGHDAVPSHWPAALDRLLDLGGEDALYVPGHGAVVDAAFVRAQRDALAARFGVSR